MTSHDVAIMETKHWCGCDIQGNPPYPWGMNDNGHEEIIVDEGLMYAKKQVCHVHKLFRIVPYTKIIQ